MFCDAMMMRLCCLFHICFLCVGHKRQHWSRGHQSLPSTFTMRQEQRQSPLLHAATTHVAPVGSNQSAQHAKPTCPLCHHSTSNALLDSLCEFHSTASIAQRAHNPSAEHFELSLHASHEYVKPSGAVDVAPSVVGHEEFPYFDSQGSAPSERAIISPQDFERSSRERDAPPTIETGCLHLPSSRSPSPNSSVPSSAPTSPRSDRDSSPSLSSSPVEHFPSWTHRDLKAAPSSSPALCPNPYTDITRLRIDSSGRGCMFDITTETCAVRMTPFVFLSALSWVHLLRQPTKRGQ